MAIIFLEGLRLHPQPREHARAAGPRLFRRVTRQMPLRVSTDGAVVSAVGEVDAGNVKDFADQVCAAIAEISEHALDITVDLSGLDFFAVDGCTALHAINAQVMRLGAKWSVSPSAAVNRVLQLCDPACLIPVTDPEELAEPA